MANVNLNPNDGNNPFARSFRLTPLSISTVLAPSPLSSIGWPEELEAMIVMRNLTIQRDDMSGKPVRTYQN